MNNLIIFPIIIPIIIGLLLMIWKDKVVIHKWAVVLTFGFLMLLSLQWITTISETNLLVLDIGGWKAPFGITIVVDMFAGILLFTTNTIALIVALYSFYSTKKVVENNYFYPVYLFLIAGVNGTFITGDIFNLFVMFEVMLVASYILISIGGKKRQLAESLKYLIVNILSSVLFLFAIALLYGLTGTLNMADLAVRASEIGTNGLITTTAFLFLIVFSLKAALFLFFWLPGSYSAPPTAVATIFAALLTKVGIYAIIRVFTLIFIYDVEKTHLVIGILGAATMILGSFGAVASRNIYQIITFNIMISVGFVICGLAAFTVDGMTGTIFYLIHDMFAKALLFLLAGTIIHLTGSYKLEDFSGLIRKFPLLGWCFFIMILAIAGIPPLSGFLGKLYVIKATFDTNFYILGAIGLISSLFVLISLLKIFMEGFWGETYLSNKNEKKLTSGLMIPIILLTIIVIGYGVGAEAIAKYILIAANTLMDPSIYIDAVLNR